MFHTLVTMLLNKRHPISYNSQQQPSGEFNQPKPPWDLRTVGARAWPMQIRTGSNHIWNKRFETQTAKKNFCPQDWLTSVKLTHAMKPSETYCCNWFWHQSFASPSEISLATNLTMRLLAMSNNLSLLYCLPPNCMTWVPGPYARLMAAQPVL